eukprot:8060014-Lingulodinium_polyedra.AAC.1
MIAELRHWLGGFSATRLADLRKAYEMVVSQKVWREAECRGLPLRIAALCLQIYAMPSVLEAFGSFQGVQCKAGHRRWMYACCGVPEAANVEGGPECGCWGPQGQGERVGG